MGAELVVAVCSLLFTLLLVRLSIPLAHRFGLLAVPGQHRRHQGSIPLTGGIAMAAGVGLTLFLLGQYPGAGIIIAGSLLLVVGVIDDRYSIPYWSRFFCQIVAVLLCIWIDDIRLTDLGKVFSTELTILGKLEVALTVFAGVGVINAVNMVDGMDGLAGSLVLVCLVSLSILLVHSGSENVELVFLLSAAVIGFLWFNLRTTGRRGARVFMGDAGSMVLGLVLAWLLITHSQGAQRAFAPVVALWIFALPLFDAVGVLLRRSVRKGSPFHADWLHTHHLLLKLGLSVNQTLTTMICAAVSLAAMGILLYLNEVPEHYLFYLFMIIFCGYVLLMELGERYLARQDPG